MTGSEFSSDLWIVIFVTWLAPLSVILGCKLGRKLGDAKATRNKAKH